MLSVAAQLEGWNPYLYHHVKVGPGGMHSSETCGLKLRVRVEAGRSQVLYPASLLK